MEGNAVLPEAVAELAQGVRWRVDESSFPALSREVLEDVEEQAEKEGCYYQEYETFRVAEGENSVFIYEQLCLSEETERLFIYNHFRVIR